MAEKDVNDRDATAAVIRHAVADMAADPRMAQPQGITEAPKEASLWQTFKESKLLGEITAFVEQGAKDAHNAFVPAFHDSLHGVDQPGTPLNPTQAMVTESLMGYDAELAAAAARGRPEQDRGMER